MRKSQRVVYPPLHCGIVCGGRNRISRDLFIFGREGFFFSSAFPPANMPLPYFFAPLQHFLFQFSGHSFIELGGAKSPTAQYLSPHSPSAAPPPPTRAAGLDERTHDHLNKHTGTQWSLCLLAFPSPERSLTPLAHPPVLQMLHVASSVQACTRSARARCEVGAPRFNSNPPTPPYPRWAAASADALAGSGAKEKGPLSHLLSMPLQAIRCNKQAEKRPFFPSSPQRAWQRNKYLNTHVGW